MLVWTSCTAELVTGWLLWPYRRLGGLLALGLLPLEFAFWIGFALPLAQGLATSDTRTSPNLIPVAEFNSGAPPARGRHAGELPLR
jgi:hypothetical protein